MKYEAIPTLRFEIDSVKSTIMSHLGVLGSELGDEISKSIDKAVATYPFDDKVRGIVHDAINSNIESYFKYGKGGESIRESINIAFKELENK